MVEVQEVILQYLNVQVEDMVVGDHHILVIHNYLQLQQKQVMMRVKVVE